MRTTYILFLIGMLIYANSAMAQTFYYNTTRTFHKNGFTYQADVSPAGWVTLYNRDNRLMGTHQLFRDGNVITEVDRGYADVERTTDVTAKLLTQYLVRNAFSATEINRLKERERLGLALIICSNTGNIQEVEFDFIRTTGYATIPVATWRRLELALKEQVRFPPTDFGRRMNFIFRSVRIDVAEQIRLHGVTGGPPPPPPPGDDPPGGGYWWIGDDPIGPVGPHTANPEEENEVLEEAELRELQ